jgi:hypothetical protein
MRAHGRVICAARPSGGQFPVVQYDIRCAPIRQLHRLAALHKSEGFTLVIGELLAVERIGFQIQTALRVQAEHQPVAVNAVCPEHAAGGDVAETGEHLVQKFDEVAHAVCEIQKVVKCVVCVDY